jgi:hypothetical protein
MAFVVAEQLGSLRVPSQGQHLDVAGLS